MYEIRSAKTDINAIAALVRMRNPDAFAALARMRNPDAFACTKGSDVLVVWTDDAGECHRAKLYDLPRTGIMPKLR